MRPSYQPYYLLAILLAAIIAGCGGLPSHEAPRSEAQLLRLAGDAADRGDYEEAGRRYVELANTSSELKRPGYLLQAANALLQGNHLAGAQQILAEVDTRKLDTTQLLRARIVAARIALAQDKPSEALQGLQIGKTDETPPALRAEAHALRSSAYRRAGDPLSAARELVLREAALDPADAKARAANQQALWQTLVMLSDDDLRRGSRSSPQAFAGWCELALIAKSTRAATPDIDQTVADWRARFPGHPASQEILDLIVARHREELSRPAHIAVLLPQSGSMAEIGQALRDGFLAAHFRRDDAGYSPSIRFYDVPGDDAAAAYAEALSNGADFIVGPLTKQAVAQVAHGRVTVPTLALNRSDLRDAAGNRPFYEFGLAPEDEARQVAQRAWNDGHARALALVPEGEWGQRVLQAFQAEWEALGGTLLESQTYPSEGSDFSDPIKRLLNVDESEQRRTGLEKLIQQPLQFEPRRRQDADLIFMAAFPRQARLIRPQLKFHYAGALPIYSTSHVFSGKRDPDADRDIDDVVFCDVPWLLAKPDSPVKADVERLWPARTAQYARFYAMGADAYNVIPYLNNLKKYPYERFNGQTGVLQLGDGNQIVRQLQWARFSNGLARPLN